MIWYYAQIRLNDQSGAGSHSVAVTASIARATVILYVTRRARKRADTPGACTLGFDTA